MRDFNDAIKKSGRKFRLETVMLVGGLTLTTLGAVAGVDPTLFAHLGIGPLQGAQVYSLGSAGAGAVLQVARHAIGRKRTDAGPDLSGAMFHQIEQETGWKLRMGSEMKKGG